MNEEPKLLDNLGNEDTEVSLVPALLNTKKNIDSKNEIVSNKKKNKWWDFFLWTLAFVMLASASFFNGYLIGRSYPKNIVIKGVDNIVDGKISNDSFNSFWMAWELIQNDYLRIKDVDNKKMVAGAGVGLLSSLGDPYSIFMPPQQAQKFNEDIKGAFGGIGAEIGFKNDFVVVIAPLKNSPAEKAGLKADDKILAVNGSSTQGYSVDEVVKNIRGLIGTEVTLNILSTNDKNPRDIKIIRDEIRPAVLDSKVTDDKIAKIHLYSFNEKSGEEFIKELNKLLKQDIKGLVIDLRNNPGGYLEVAVDLASVFMDKGLPVVFEERRTGDRKEYTARGNGELKDLPVVVLVNKGSASASEILAGALRDNKNAPIIGETSFGKGTVQELKNLPDGSSVKLTIAHWVMPKGLIIDKNGIKPDYEIKPTEEKIKAGVDEQYEKALEVVREMIKNKK